MSETPDDIQKMAERIQKEKNKKKYANSENNKEESPSSVAMAFQISVELISGVLVGVGIGYILDELFDTHLLCILIFTILGGFAGMLNVYRYVNKTDESKERG